MNVPNAARSHYERRAEGREKQVWLMPTPAVVAGRWTQRSKRVPKVIGMPKAERHVVGAVPVKLTSHNVAAAS